MRSVSKKIQDIQTKAEKTDVIEAELVGKSDTTHNHNLNDLSEKSYNSLTNKPTSLPANGGNADTVDGKHASELMPINPSSINFASGAWELYNEGGSWWQKLRVVDTATLATKRLIFEEAQGSEPYTELFAVDGEGNTFSGGNRNLTTADEGSGNGIDADTVDGKHASEFLEKAGGTMSGILKANGGGTIGVTADIASAGLQVGSTLGIDPNQFLFDIATGYIGSTGDLLLGGGSGGTQNDLKIGANHNVYISSNLYVGGNSVWHQGNTIVDANGFIKEV
jgi:hypothetical protein